jgi:tetratricopeptide (TPR) repeat protein
LGGVYIFTNRAAQGIAECERALALDRNLADAHGAIGIAKYFMGPATETESHILEALRLSPRDFQAHRWMHIVAMAKMQLSADAEAVAWLRRSIEDNRNFPPTPLWLAAALGLLGALDEARTAAKPGLALDPSFTIRRLLVTQLRRQSELSCRTRARLRGHAPSRGARGMMSELGHTEKNSV